MRGPCARFIRGRMLPANAISTFCHPDLHTHARTFNGPFFGTTQITVLCEMLSDDLRHPTDRSNALPADTQLLAALQLYSSESFQWMIARKQGNLFIEHFRK